MALLDFTHFKGVNFYNFYIACFLCISGSKKDYLYLFGVDKHVVGHCPLHTQQQYPIVIHAAHKDSLYDSM